MAPLNVVCDFLCVCVVSCLVLRFNASAGSTGSGGSTTDVAAAPQIRLDEHGQIVIDNSSIDIGNNSNGVSQMGNFGGIINTL